jgi:serine/threonine protein kinase
MLEREITTAARLRHPHVVQVYGACVYSPTELWLVMEYADGGSLFSKIADKSKACSNSHYPPLLPLIRLSPYLLHVRRAHYH